jgi:hypothetical protein
MSLAPSPGDLKILSLTRRSDNPSRPKKFPRKFSALTPFLPHPLCYAPPCRQRHAW